LRHKWGRAAFEAQAKKARPYNSLHARGESMDETKQKESVYSRERAEMAAVGNPAETTESFENDGQASKETQKTQMDVPVEIIRSSGYSLFADFTEFLKQTKRTWLMLAGAAFGLMVMVILVKDVAEWAGNARERRQEQAIASVTPERLIARCGQPAEDLTKEVYPILMRTMSYQPKGERKLVVSFSRTAEEKSDWVFLSMKDEIESRNYDSPEAEIAALPCMDSKK
jgi:hypothetical protein